MDKTEIQKQGLGGGGEGGGCRGWLKFCISLKVLYFFEAVFVIFDCVDDSICNHHFFISFLFSFIYCV